MKIKRIKKLDKKEMTVDIQVEDTHSYQLSNGCVVHNTTSKLFGLTEGWHLPAMTWYMRWVQFRDDDPLLKEYGKAGYPTKALVKYPNTVIVGFPTEPIISSLEMGTKLITAGEATMEEQYQWLALGEKYWINGTDEEGNPLKEQYGNQISYTLKYFQKEIDIKSFKSILQEHQQNIRCCSVMPQSDEVSYEYQPEQPITKAEYESHLMTIQNIIKEDIGKEHVDCGMGGCPVDFNES